MQDSTTTLLRLLEGDGAGDAAETHAIAAQLRRIGVTAAALRDRPSARPCDVPYVMQGLGVNDGALWLDDYPTEAAAVDRISTISPAGPSAVGGLLQMRVRVPGYFDAGQPPRWYRAGRLVAEYRGDDMPVLAAIQDVLGPPVVVGLDFRGRPPALGAS